MALIVEDGSGLADAQVYASVATARAYAAQRGAVLPVSDSAVEALLLDATLYIESYRSQFQGSKAWPAAVADPPHPAQALQWPRVNVYLDDAETPFPSDALPRELIAAQCQLVVEGASGVNYMASRDGRVVKRTKVDVLETEYMTAQETGTSGPPTVAMPRVDALLAPLLGNNAGFGLGTVRV